MLAAGGVLPVLVLAAAISLDERGTGTGAALASQTSRAEGEVACGLPCWLEANRFGNVRSATFGDQSFPSTKAKGA